MSLPRSNSHGAKIKGYPAATQRQVAAPQGKGAGRLPSRSSRAIVDDHEALMSPFTTTLIEWGSTLLSLVGFWFCIQHRASCFLVFLVADAGWFVSAWMNDHSSLLAQQAVYIFLNIVGYVMWRRDERLKAALEAIEQRDLEEAGEEVELISNR